MLPPPTELKIDWLIGDQIGRRSGSLCWKEIQPTNKKERPNGLSFCQNNNLATYFVFGVMEQFMAAIRSALANITELTTKKSFSLKRAIQSVSNKQQHGWGQSWPTWYFWQNSRKHWKYSKTGLISVEALEKVEKITDYHVGILLYSGNTQHSWYRYEC